MRASRLALVTVLQYAAGLTDRQAADGVRERIDWKYALALELTDPGFDFSLLLDRLLEVCKQRGWLKRRGQATHRFDPCLGTGALAFQSGMRGRNAAGHPG